MTEQLRPEFLEKISFSGTESHRVGGTLWWLWFMLSDQTGRWRTLRSGLYQSVVQTFRL